MFPALDAFQVPGKSDYRTSAVPGLHLSGKRVNQELSRESDKTIRFGRSESPCTTENTENSYCLKW